MKGLIILSLAIVAACVESRDERMPVFCPPTSERIFEDLLGSEFDASFPTLSELLRLLRDRGIRYDRVADSTLLGCHVEYATTFYQVYAGTDDHSQRIFKIAADNAGHVLAINEIVLTRPRLPWNSP